MTQWPLFRRDVRFLLVLIAWGIVGTQAFAAGGVQHLVSPGEPVRGPSITAISFTRPDSTSVTIAATPWPDRVLDLVNDPLRTDGWNWWFTEFPNDVDTFDFAVQTPNDVQHVAHMLSRIRSGSLRAELVPTAGPGKTLTDQRATTIGVEFRIGNQAVVDHWIEHRAEQSGFNISPVACPPTLRLYSRHPAVDLTSLRFSPNVVVVADVKGANMDDPEVAAAVQAIEKFAAAHQARRATLLRLVSEHFKRRSPTADH